MKRAFLFVVAWTSISAVAEPGASTDTGDSAVVVSTELPKTVITSKSARVAGKGSSAEFVGDVTLTRGGDFLSADRLVTEDKNNLARAWGHVFFRREGAGGSVRWEAWGDRATYDTQAASGTLWGEGGPARTRRTPLEDSVAPGGVIDMKAPEISFAQVVQSTETSGYSTAIVKGRGGVYLKSVEAGPAVRVTELWSERADFDGPTDRFRFEGAFLPWGETIDPAGPPPQLDRPYVRQTQGREKRELRGDIIDLHPTDRRLVAQRAVRADLLFESSQPPSKEGSGKKSKGRKTGVSSR